MHHIFVILKRGGRSYEYIVHIDDNFDSTFRPLIFEWLKNMVHHVLEGRGGVAVMIDLLLLVVGHWGSLGEFKRRRITMRRA